MVRVGMRYDRFTGDLNVNLQNSAKYVWQSESPNTVVLRPGHYKSKGFNAYSPKFGLLFTPIKGLELYANYGKGFQLPSSDTSFFTDPLQKLAYREQYEVGFRTSPYDWISAGIGYYRLYSENDLYYNPATMESENIGETLRTGVETYVDLFPFPNWTFHVDYTYQDAKNKKFVDYMNNDLAGRRLTRVPRHISHYEISYEPEQGLGGWVRFSWYADSVSNDTPAQTLRFQDYGSLDLQLNWRFNEKYQITLEAKNLLDKDYYGMQWFDGTGNFTYSPQNPLAVYLGLNINFE
jgi:outer membrane receptor protein involved in Fe transport